MIRLIENLCAINGVSGDEQDVAAAIIETVKYKVEHLTGVAVGRVNVCVEDIRV